MQNVQPWDCDLILMVDGVDGSFSMEVYSMNSVERVLRAGGEGLRNDVVSVV